MSEFDRIHGKGRTYALLSVSTADKDVDLIVGSGNHVLLNEGGVLRLINQLESALTQLRVEEPA